MNKGCIVYKQQQLLYSIFRGYGNIRIFGKHKEFGGQNVNVNVLFLARLYPCSDCAEDMRSDLVESPPRVSSASEFSLWLCQLHNKVNVKLGEFAV